MKVAQNDTETQSSFGLMPIRLTETHVLLLYAISTNTQAEMPLGEKPMAHPTVHELNTKGLLYENKDLQPALTEAAEGLLKLLPLFVRTGKCGNCGDTSTESPQERISEIFNNPKKACPICGHYHFFKP